MEKLKSRPIRQNREREREREDDDDCFSLTQLSEFINEKVDLFFTANFQRERERQTERERDEGENE